MMRQSVMTRGGRRHFSTPARVIRFTNLEVLEGFEVYVRRSVLHSSENPKPPARLRLATPLRQGQTLASFGMNLSAAPLLHQRWLVGGGPSSKRWPWWPPQRLQWYSVRG